MTALHLTTWGDPEDRHETDDGAFKPMKWFNALVTSGRYAALSGSAQRVVAVLFAHAGSSGVAWPSIDKLVEETALSRRAVQYAIEELDRSGVIIRHEPGYDGHRSATYVMADLQKAHEIKSDNDGWGATQCTPGVQNSTQRGATHCTQTVFNSSMNVVRSDDDKKEKVLASSPGPSRCSATTIHPEVSEVPTGGWRGVCFGLFDQHEAMDRMVGSCGFEQADAGRLIERWGPLACLRSSDRALAVQASGKLKSSLRGLVVTDLHQTGHDPPPTDDHAPVEQTILPAPAKWSDGEHSPYHDPDDALRDMLLSCLPRDRIEKAKAQAMAELPDFVRRGHERRPPDHPMNAGLVVGRLMETYGVA